MGSPISTIVADLFKEKFEIKANNSAIQPSTLCFRYVDNTFVIQKAEHSINPHIQFTQETPDTKGSIPFLDTLVSPGPDNTLLTTVYRNHTHTDQCVHWDTHHKLSASYSVFNTLAHRARAVVLISNYYIRKRNTSGRL